MKKFFTLTLGVFIVIIVAIIALGMYTSRSSQNNETRPPAEIVPTTEIKKPISFMINGKTLTFKSIDSKDVVLSSGGSSVRIFGEPFYADFNKDGEKDAALLLVETKIDGTTTFYASLALKEGDSYTPTNVMMIGENIAPQTINEENGRAIYNYAERKAGEATSTAPSQGKSLYIHYDAATNTIGEWVKDFEGEADSKKMSLSMKKWSWVKTQLNDDTTTTPKKDVFTLTFSSDGKVSVTTDCNSMNATYTTKGNAITFGPFMSTKMYCEGSQEQAFAKTLSKIDHFLFTGKGELVLEIKMGTGGMFFR